MALTKSKPNNINRPDGNTLYLYLDDPSGTLYLIDVLGNVAPLSDYINGGSATMENAGNGAQIYKAGTSEPFVVRSIKQGARVTITEDANEIEITADEQTNQNIGAGSQIYVAGTNSPSQFRTLKAGANVFLTQNTDNIEIAMPVGPNVPLYYGSFYSTQTQTTVGNEQKEITLNNTDAAATLGVSIVSNSRITVAHAGIYNLAFSAQIKKTSGGGATQIYIFLKKNGSLVPDSNTVLTLANNGDLLVAAWNLFVNLTAGEYVELFWYATAASIELHYNATPVVGLPAIPSVILTMNRVG